jgi:hypothetical protein
VNPPPTPNPNPFPAPPVAGQSCLAREFARVVLGFLALFLFTNSGFDTSEGTIHYQLAVRFVREGTIAQPEAWGEHYLFKAAPNGRRYCVHEAGNILFAIPAAAGQVALEKLAGARMTPERSKQLEGFLAAGLPSFYQAIGAGLFYMMLRTVFAQPVRRAFGATLAMALTTFFWTYSRMLFDGVLAGMLVTGAFWLLFLHGRNGSLTALALSGGCLGCGIITRITLVLALAVAGIYLWLISRPDYRALLRRGAVYGLAVAPFLAWLLAYNRLRTGSPFALPAAGYENNALTGSLLTGLAGLLFSPGKGIFLYVPVFALSLLALPAAFRRFPREMIATGLLVGCWFALHAKLYSWYGAWGWGPRHFVTITPLLALPWAASLGPSLRSIPRWLAWSSLGLGFALEACSIMGNWLYRLSRLSLQGKDPIASPLTAQPVDMVVGAWENVRHMLGIDPAPVLPAASALNQYASTTVNIWLNTMTHMGLPWLVAVVIGAALVGTVAACWRPMWRRETAAGTPPPA